MSYLSLILLNLVPVFGVLFFNWPVQGVYWFFIMELFLSLVFNYFKLKLFNKSVVPSRRKSYGSYLFATLLGAFIPLLFVFVLSFGSEFWYPLPFWFPRIENHLPEIALLLVSFGVDYYYFKKENFRKHDMAFLIIGNPLYSITFVFVLLISTYMIPYSDVDVVRETELGVYTHIESGSQVWGAVIGVLLYLTGRALLKKKFNCYF